EEARFLQTLDTGTALLNEQFSALRARNERKLPSDFVFKLYDTYGFPVDLTRLMAQEKGYLVVEGEVESLLENARKVAQASWKGKALSTDEAHLIAWSQAQSRASGPTEFKGYESLHEGGKILALSNGKSEVESLGAGERGLLIVNKTPFYAESGGQVGDQGGVQSERGAALVHDTTKHHEIFVHHVEVSKGKLKRGDAVQLEVESRQRRQIAANHSATHLLHAALRAVLGSHVSQAGSLVDASKLRFDFTHNKALSSEELLKIEELVNEQVSLARPVQPSIMSYQEAINSGAMALFGEKYGATVRVLKMGDFSTELCGGTHVSNTVQIRLFKIVSESGVSAGVRRIEALTGDGALKFLLKHCHENNRARVAAGISESWSTFLSVGSVGTSADATGESRAQVADWIEASKLQIRELERAVRDVKSGQVDLDQIVGQARQFQFKTGSHRLILWRNDQEDREILARWADELKNKIQSGVVVILGKGQPASPLIVSVTKSLNPEISAGDLLKDLANGMGGKGGGRPDFAQGAVPHAEKWEASTSALTKRLGI
ncbi:MAG: alanine--tRNA ligase, partial [Bdellovibrio sp.]